MTENQKSILKISQPQPSQEPSPQVKLRLKVGDILEDSQKNPKNYVKEWLVLGGGE